jgi:hypothetical protein
MKVYQRGGLIIFLCGLGFMIMMATEKFIKGYTTGNVWMAVLPVVIGALLFIIGDG